MLKDFALQQKGLAYGSALEKALPVIEEADETEKQKNSLRRES